MSLLEFTLTASLTQQDPGHRTRNKSIMDADHWNYFHVHVLFVFNLY